MLGAVWLLDRPPAPAPEPAPGSVGFTIGRSDADLRPADASLVWSPPTAPTAAPPASADAPTPIGKRATRAPAKEPSPEALLAPREPPPEGPPREEPAEGLVDPGPRAPAGGSPTGVAPGATGGGAGGGARGSGTIRHTALADQAPMAFLGVEGLPPLPGREPGELWVAQTEVTEAQWQALMRLDLAILTGRPDRPAEHMTFCEALDYANRLSRLEGLRPAYMVPRGCHLGAAVRWDTAASGYRLPTEEEWERMAGDRPGSGATRRDDVYRGEADGAGLYGVSGNAAELVWTEGGVPVARHRGCGAAAISGELWPESDPLPCRQVLPPGQRTVGVGLRLVRAAR